MSQTLHSRYRWYGSSDSDKKMMKLMPLLNKVIADKEREVKMVMMAPVCIPDLVALAKRV
jgi:hypothetical protein